MPRCAKRAQRRVVDLGMVPRRAGGEVPVVGRDPFGIRLEPVSQGTMGVQQDDRVADRGAADGGELRMGEVVVEAVHVQAQAVVVEHRLDAAFIRRDGLGPRGGEAGAEREVAALDRRRAEAGGNAGVEVDVLVDRVFAADVPADVVAMRLDQRLHAARQEDERAVGIHALGIGGVADTGFERERIGDGVARLRERRPGLVRLVHVGRRHEERLVASL